MLFGAFHSPRAGGLGRTTLRPLQSAPSLAEARNGSPLPDSIGAEVGPVNVGCGTEGRRRTCEGNLLNDRERNARVVLLPAIPDLHLADTLKRFFEEGGAAVLLGETREEYVARKMSDVRRSAETEAQFQEFTGAVARYAPRALIALDQEPGGIERLHGLAPGFPDAAELRALGIDEIEDRARRTGEKARTLGVNMFLAPVIDVVTGANPWLRGRTLGEDPAEVGRIAAAFVTGVQRSGVLATAKHFPGHREITGDPAIEMAEVPGDAGALEPGYVPVRSVIDAGVGAIMTGPAIVTAIDRASASSRSADTIAMLREKFGFDGLVVSDDIDSATMLGNQSPADVAVATLVAGSDLLLLAASNDLVEVSARIVAAVERGELSEERLARAARNVERMLR